MYPEQRRIQNLVKDERWSFLGTRVKVKYFRKSSILDVWLGSKCDSAEAADHRFLKDNQLLKLFLSKVSVLKHET